MLYLLYEQEDTSSPILSQLQDHFIKWRYIDSITSIRYKLEKLPKKDDTILDLISVLNELEKVLPDMDVKTVENIYNDLVQFLSSSAGAQEEPSNEEQ
jgi:hypothetical protein